MTSDRRAQECVVIRIHRGLLVVCSALSLLALAAAVLSHLALTDIARGEADLTSEWAVLRASAVVVIGLCLAALALVWQVCARLARFGPRV